MTNTKWLAPIFCISFMVAGCGTTIIHPEYQPSSNLSGEIGKGVTIKVVVQDDRAHKYIYRCFGTSTMHKEQGNLLTGYHLNRTSRQIVEESLLVAFASSGFRVSETSSIEYRIKLIRFGVTSHNYSRLMNGTVECDIAIFIEGVQKTIKRVTNTFTQKAFYGEFAQECSTVLSQALSQTVEEIVQDPELVAAATRKKADESEPISSRPRLASRVSTPLGPVAQRWAVVVGISDYAHETNRLSSLKYAHRDAEKFATFLKSKAGGSFPAANVKLLTDSQATGKGIRGALFDFLKKTVKEDMVIIFFSGHGIPDPDKPSNLYLVAHDSDPAKIASTGIPMWDIETALKRTIAAERVIVLADTCHSAGFTEGVKGVKIGDQFNNYFEQLAKAKPGRVIFTSCEGYEVSREGKKWGGGHGVFTWALLEGMKGKADANRNGIVTLGEMLDYVDITVRRETANEQHPTKAGVRFDRNLPMGVVK